MNCKDCQYYRTIVLYQYVPNTPFFKLEVYRKGYCLCLNKKIVTFFNLSSPARCCVNYTPIRDDIYE